MRCADQELSGKRGVTTSLAVFFRYRERSPHAHYPPYFQRDANSIGPDRSATTFYSSKIQGIARIDLVVRITAQYGALGWSLRSLSKPLSRHVSCKLWTQTKLILTSSVARESSRTSPQRPHYWAGTSKRLCPKAVRHIALRRWACSPAFTMSVPPIPNLASFWLSIESSSLVADPMSPAAVNVARITAKLQPPNPTAAHLG